MLRELAQIVLAIHLSLSPQQHLPEKLIQYYATEIQAGGNSTEVDPLIFVAIITHESQWRSNAISPDQQDWGLMQVRGKYYSGGQHNDWLLNPHTNIQVGAYLIKKSMEYCTSKLDRQPLPQEWLSIYQGSGFGCKPTKLTKLFEDYYLCLKEDVENPTDDVTDYKKIYWHE